MCVFKKLDLIDLNVNYRLMLGNLCGKRNARIYDAKALQH
jgi:hypothetical protein